MSDSHKVNGKQKKGEDDMATVEEVKKPVDRFRESFNEYLDAQKSNEKMMSYSEMMKRLKEDDE